jgi:hypothetical protein
MIHACKGILLSKIDAWKVTKSHQSLLKEKRLWERLTMLEASIYFLDTYVNS